MNQILYSRKKEKKAKRIAIILGVLFLLAILVSVIFYIINIGNEKILKGVYINEIYVGGLTESEATSKIVSEMSELRKKELILKMEDEEFKYTYDDFGLSYANTLATTAYNYGRSGNIVSDNYTILSSYLGDEYRIKEGLTIESTKVDIVSLELLEDFENSTLNDEYVIKDNKLIIKKGHDGANIRIEELKAKIEESINSNDFNGKIEVPMNKGIAERIDIDKIYDEIYIKKVDASYVIGEKFDVIKEVEGISFDKVKAKELYENAEAGETIEIELVKDIPEVKLENLNDVLYKDVLAEFETKYDQSYTARVTNLQVASKNMNGTILYPGEEFSYNKVVGERTAARGFKEAHVFSGGKVVDGLGGGICQVSSTLYNAVLYANLEVTSRTAHMMDTGYVKPSLDATVVYGSIDFKFKNNRKTPIKIESIVKNGKVTVKIYGIKMEDDPIVELKSVKLKNIPYTTVTNYDPNMDEGTSKVTQSPMNGCVSEAYKILKDSKGNVISETLISKDTYKQTSKIITVGTKKVEKPPVVVTPEIPDEPIVEPPVQPEDPGPDLPAGWDTPENPYYN